MFLGPGQFLTVEWCQLLPWLSIFTPAQKYGKPYVNLAVAVASKPPASRDINHTPGIPAGPIL